MTVRAGGDVTLRHGDTVYLTPQEGKVHRFGPDGKNLA
jgi:multiple sugar transport system ATP-binding protein